MYTQTHDYEFSNRKSSHLGEWPAHYPLRQTISNGNARPYQRYNHDDSAEKFNSLPPKTKERVTLSTWLDRDSVECSDSSNHLGPSETCTTLAEALSEGDADSVRAGDDITECVEKLEAEENSLLNFQEYLQRRGVPYQLNHVQTSDL